MRAALRFPPPIVPLPVRFRPQGFGDAGRHRQRPFEPAQERQQDDEMEEVPNRPDAPQQLWHALGRIHTDHAKTKMSIRKIQKNHL